MSRRVIVTIPVEITIDVEQYAKAAGIIPPGLTTDALDARDISGDFSLRVAMNVHKDAIVPAFAEYAVTRISTGQATYEEL